MGLWLLLHRYHIDRGQALHVDLSVLMSVEFCGDLAAYLDLFESQLANLSKPPDKDPLHALETQLRKCKALQPDFLV